MFDSGLGGLSVWKALVRQLPAESVLYVADQAYCPYGSRPTAEIQDRSRKITEFLLEKGAKLILVACNTATAAAIDQLRSEFEVPFVGMEPAVKPAAKATRSGKVGILATQGTFRGRLFQRTRAHFASEVEVVLQVGHGLVELVEQGHTDTAAARQLLEQYLQPMLREGVDQIVLGCTHYPFLRSLMEEIVAGQAVILDPAPAVARQTLRLLKKADALAPADLPVRHQFFATSTLGRLQRLAQGLLTYDQSKQAAFWRVEL
jgi:glutamate racemase